MTSQGEAASRAEADRLKLELQELKEKEGIKDTYVGSYLLERLVQLGVKVCSDSPSRRAECDDPHSISLVYRVTSTLVSWYEARLRSLILIDARCPGPRRGPPTSRMGRKLVRCILPSIYARELTSTA